ncbi:MAG: sulfatase [Oscillospiraceae bacterium]|nr:sulfatase [Oscillospiraceae bacterium]
MKRPNVVLLISHDTGRFYEPYGIGTVSQPNFMRLAGMAVTFDGAYCVTPLCSPARSSIVTGRYPHQNGVNGLPGDTLGRWEMVERDRHLASVLGKAGYRTVLCGGYAHELSRPLESGFDFQINDFSVNKTDTVKDAGPAIGAWLDANPKAGSEEPLYMQVVCAETHRDWDRLTDAYDAKGVWKAPYLIDDPEVDRDMAYMQGSANDLDAGLGGVIGAFEARGLAHGTIFAVTTDHGLDFPRAKGTLFDPGVEVGLFMRYDAGGWAAGGRCGSLVSHLDVYPTLLEACGVPVPEGTEGISLLGHLKDPKGAAPIRDAVFLEKTYHDNYDPMRGIRTGSHKYVLNFDAQTLYDVRVATAPKYGWFRFPFIKSEREELYDLARDPDEAHNLAKDPGYAEMRDGLRLRLARWMRETGDPLLFGPMPSPYHLRVCGEMRALAGSEE